jgi:hypothetical protein
MTRLAVLLMGAMLVVLGLVPSIQVVTPCRLTTAVSGQLVTLRGKYHATGHDGNIIPDGCSEQVFVLLQLPGDPDAGLEDPSIGPRFLRDPEYRKFLAVPEAYDVAMTVTGCLDISDGNDRQWDPLSERLRVGAFGHPIPYAQYRLVMLYVSDVVSWPRGTPRPDIRRE